MARKQQNKNDLWYESEKRLRHADAVINKNTGDIVKIDNNNLHTLHEYMLDQYNSYTRIGETYFESQINIGIKCRIKDPKTLRKYFKILISLNLLEIIGKKGRSDVYRVYSVGSQEKNLEFQYPVLEDGETPSYDHQKLLKSLKGAGDGKNNNMGGGEQCRVECADVPASMVTPLQPVLFMNKTLENKTQKNNKVDLPCQVYLQKLTSPVLEFLKVGISRNTIDRIRNQKKTSEFSHSIIGVWEFTSRREALRCENKIKNEFATNVINKKWMSDGYTETCYIKDEDMIVSTINKYATNKGATRIIG